ncbi:MAG TPA: amidohydrolase [Verrucomicrobiae bacterium]|nr:amidohydrolase [Verrucomicrobiae bacterium]
MPAADPAPRPADLILVGGSVWTGDAVGRWAEGVAILDGRIVAVGSDHELRAWAGPATEVVPLRGRMVCPGFQDAHIHPAGGGLDRRRCDLSSLRTRPEYLAAIRAYAQAHPDLSWILGRGWSMPAFPGGIATATELDQAVPDRPCFLRNRDGHGAWVNSRALELAGIDAATSDPVDGRIERDDAGSPVGTLHEGARDLVERLVPQPSEAEREAAILEAQAYTHQLGITAWQDANLDWRGGRYASLDAYLRLVQRGLLSVRVVGALWWDRHQGLEQVQELVEVRERARRGGFRATTVKIMQDGVLENFTAGVLEPYLDGHGCATDRHGLSFVDPDVLVQAVPALDRAGFQVHFHAIGERAVREALDAVEAARQSNGMNDLRHHIAHIQVIHPDDVGRFRGLQVAANAQPLWAVSEPQMTELTIPFLGPVRSAWQYPFASLARQGAVVAFGSDWPVSSCDPLWQLHVAVNRLPPAGDVTHQPNRAEAIPFLPEEGLSLAVALRASTMGSAYVNHLDAESGSLEVGKAADLVVLDRNIFEESQLAIGSARVLLTLVNGRTVHQDRSGWR